MVFCRDSELKMNNRIPFSKVKERFPYALFTRLPCLSRGEGMYTSVCERKGQRKILGEEGEGEKERKIKKREICQVLLRSTCYWEINCNPTILRLIFNVHCVSGST